MNKEPSDFKVEAAKKTDVRHSVLLIRSRKWPNKPRFSFVAFTSSTRFTGASIH